MAHLQPLPKEQVQDLEPFFATAKAVLGFVPNSLLTMARRPEILQGFSGLAKGVFAPSGGISTDLKMLVAYVSSTAAECRYCQAHSAVSAVRAGVHVGRVAQAGDFENDSQFSDAEKAALRFARDAAMLPNAVTRHHFEALHKHFNDDEIVQLMAVIAIMGFLNRWNDTMATELEVEPMALGMENLVAHGWQGGKHSPAQAQD